MSGNWLASAGWGSERVVTTGWRRAVTTRLARGLAGAGRWRACGTWHPFPDLIAGHCRNLRVKKKKPEGCGPFRLQTWSRQQESNLHLALRRHSFCPLNYGERERGLYCGPPVGPGCGSVVATGEDQVRGALLAGAGAQREALRKVVADRERTQGPARLRS